VEAPDPRAVSAQLRVLERNVPLFGFGVALLLLGPPMVYAFFARAAPWGLFGLPITIGGLWATVGTVWANLRARPRRGEVCFSDRGIELDGALRVPRARIHDAFYQPRSDRDEHRSSLRVLGKSRTVLFEVEVPEEPRAVAFLRALRLDARSRRAAFTGAPPLLSVWFGKVPVLAVVGVVLALVMYWLEVTTLPLPALVALLVSPLLVAVGLPMRIVVGSDGVLLQWLWWRKFIPMADVTTVGAVGEQSIVLGLRSGRTETIHTTIPRNDPSPGPRLHRDAVLARIREAHHAFAAEIPSEEVAGLVARGERPTSEWIAALEVLARGGGGYREIAVRDEDLLRLVEDNSAPEAARAGAAIALRGRRSQDAEGRARVRVAAEATASPRLRVALEAALGEGDTSLEVALDALEEDKAKRAE